MRSKHEFRTLVKAMLKELPNQDEKSDRIWDHIRSLPEFQNGLKTGKMIMIYANKSQEVQTTRFFTKPDGTVAFPVAVPFCEQGNLVLFRLESLEQLEPITLGIPEPKLDLRQNEDRLVQPNELAMVLVPGLAFDVAGGRIGRGAGYFDRFLREVPARSPKIAIAFDCQVFDKVPMEHHDQYVDIIVTEKRVIRVNIR